MADSANVVVVVIIIIIIIIVVVVIIIIIIVMCNSTAGEEANTFASMSFISCRMRLFV